MAILGKHAIVIGGSMGGLMAAGTLSDFYDEVTIIERDALPIANVPRKGAPQGRHTHGLLARGSRTLEEMFPGFAADIAAEGGLSCDIAQEVVWYNFGCVLRDQPSDINGYLISRPALENAVRRRVAQLPNVRIRDATEAVEPQFDATTARVIGLAVRPTGVSQGAETIAADLVVDAGGRGGRSPAWLERWGFQKPEEEAVRVELAYLSRHYRRRPDHLPGKKGVIIAAGAPDWRVGALLAQEGNRWVVTIGGYFGDRAPDDDAGFLEYARGLQRPEIYDVLKDAEPLDTPAPYNFPASLRRHYEKLARFPEGYLVFGDALCSFNPIYGQGMSVAAMEAVTLSETLAKGSAGLAKRFFAAANQTIDIPWQMAVGADLAHPQVEGARPLPVRFINWYIAKFVQAGGRDAFLAKRFLEVANLLAPPTALLSPATAWRVWRTHMRTPRELASRRQIPAYHS